MSRDLARVDRHADPDRREPDEIDQRRARGDGLSGAHVDVLHDAASGASMIDAAGRDAALTRRARRGRARAFSSASATASSACASSSCAAAAGAVLDRCSARCDLAGRRVAPWRPRCRRPAARSTAASRSDGWIGARRKSSCPRVTTDPAAGTACGACSVPATGAVIASVDPGRRAISPPSVRRASDRRLLDGARS